MRLVDEIAGLTPLLALAKPPAAKSTGGLEPDWDVIFALVKALFGLGMMAAFIFALVHIMNRLHESKVALRREAEAKQRARWEHLAARFGPDAATGIMQGQFWQGMTAEMVMESLGRPQDVDEKVLKTKVKHTYKYRSLGANRYGLRIFLDDGVVVGWENQG